MILWQMFILFNIYISFVIVFNCSVLNNIFYPTSAQYWGKEGFSSCYFINYWSIWSFFFLLYSVLGENDFSLEVWFWRQFRSMKSLGFLPRSFSCTMCPKTQISEAWTPFRIRESLHCSNVMLAPSSV